METKCWIVVNLGPPRPQLVAAVSKGETALIFGIGSLALLSLSFLFPYAIFGAIVAAIVAIIAGGAARKKDPSDKKAKTAKLLGWITLGLIAALVIIAVATLSGLYGGW